MKITRLTAENFKRLVAVDITPDGTAVVIGGRNAQGKTSVLDAIMATVAGRKGSKEITRPIRDGETKARVALEIEDLIVERRWTASGSEVTVRPKGSTTKINSPQKVLDSLIGALAFDPLEFAESDPKAQVETMIDIVGREPFEAIASARRAAYENRTEINRDVKRYQVEVETRNDAKQVEPVDGAALAAEARAARDKQRLTDRWHDLTAEIARLQADLAEVVTQGAALADVRDLEEVEADRAAADQINREAQRWIDLVAAQQAFEEAQRKSESYTSQIEALDAQRADLVAAAALPVPGLTFNDEGVLLNGVPFGQSSAAERLKVSVAMAMAMNPELRVICVRDASLLDDDSKRALVAMAAERDYQIWIEVVGDPGEVGVLIEDGQVVTS